MKRFVTQILVLLTLFAAVLAGSLLLIPNRKIPDNSLFASIDKHHRLSEVDSPKVLLVGGSNLSFGIMSQMIEDSLHLPVVNMGLHAGFGMRYILSEVKPHIQAGDRVIVSLEYHHFWDSEMFNGEDVLVAMLFDVNRDCLRYVSLGQWIAMLPKIALYSTKKLIDLDAPISDEFADSFTREAYNKYGDVVSHYGLPSKVHSGFEPVAQGGVSKRSVRELARFKSFVVAQGAEFYMVATPYPEPQYICDSNAITQIEVELAKKGIAYQIPPVECLFPDSLFFNSYFHLSQKGAELRTSQLIDHLR